MTATVSESSLGPEWAQTKPNETPPSRPTHFPKAPSSLGWISTCRRGGDTNIPFVTIPSSAAAAAAAAKSPEFTSRLCTSLVGLLYHIIGCYPSLFSAHFLLQERFLWNIFGFYCDPWQRKIPWRRKRQPTPVFLSGESRGQRSLAGYSLWGHRVRHDWATFTFGTC